MVTKRVTANLPRNLLDDAIHVTGCGITETLVEGLRVLARRRAYEKAMRLKGRLKLRVDIDTARERARR